VTLASRALTRLWSDANADEADLQRSTAAFLHLTRSAPHQSRPAWLPWAQHQIAAGEATTATSIAETLGMHPRWLAHAYRQAAGEGLRDTILRTRTERAAHLLRSTDSPIAEIAFATGFCDQSHMNRVVGHFTGRTPATIRAEREQLARIAGR
jgi:AraC family transcriptional regulator